MKPTKTVELQIEDAHSPETHSPEIRSADTHTGALHTEDHHDIHGLNDHAHHTPAQEKRFKWEGWRVIIGGVLIHLILGTFYLWGSISVYIASYLRAHNEGVTLNLVKLAFPLMNLAINGTLSFGVKLANKIGHKTMMWGSIILMAGTVFIVSFIKNFWAFLLIYAIVLGVSSGMVYMIPVVCGLRYFPTKKGNVID